MAQSIIKNDDIFYRPGETVVFGVNGFAGHGDITDSGKELNLFISLPKRLDKISSATLNTFIGGLRGVKGYLDSTVYNTDWLARSGLTWALKPMGSFLHIKISKTSAFGNYTNNTPISAIPQEASITFS